MQFAQRTDIPDKIRGVGKLQPLKSTQGADVASQTETLVQIQTLNTT